MAHRALRLTLSASGFDAAGTLRACGETTRTIAALPTWVERIHALEKLAPDPTVTIERVVADTSSDIDVGDDPHFVFWRVAAEVLARVIPSDRWIPLVARLADAEYTHERMVLVDILVSQRGPTLVPAAIAAFDTLPRHALRRIDLAWRDGTPPPPALVAAWPQVLVDADPWGQRCGRA